MITSKDMVRRAISSNDRSGADRVGGERVALVRFMKVREAGNRRPARLQLAGPDRAMLRRGRGRPVGVIGPRQR